MLARLYGWLLRRSWYKPKCKACGETLDIWFDRTLCPPPCGKMHDCCVNCGEPVGDCPIG